MFVFQEWLVVVSIPTLESAGLLPRGAHECSLDDISAQFTWNDHRTQLFTSFRLFLVSELQSHFPYPILFDESFVTHKELPSDTDVVLDLSGATDAQKWNATQCSINQQIFPLIPERFLSELPKPPLPLAGNRDMIGSREHQPD
jgi:hypothetical protein